MMKGPIKSKTAKPHQHLSFVTRGISMDMTKYYNIKKYLTPKYYSKEDIPLSNSIPQPKEKFHSFSPTSAINDNNYLLLPSLKPSELQSLKTLVLDLDETLIHSGFNQFSIEADIHFKVDLENQTKEIFVLMRPYLDEFLKRVSKCYEIVIFTASLSKYANRLIDIIDKEGVCKYRLFRDQCTFINNAYVKELKRLNRNMKNVVIVDNNPNSFCLDKENGIPIKSFIEDKNDNELIQIAYVLEKIAKGNDVRVLIKEIVYMNQIHYDKAFELFKTKETDDRLIEECSQYLVNTVKDKICSINEEKEIDDQKGIKILNVEKIELNHQNTQLKTNNESLYIKQPIRQINSYKDNSVGNHQLMSNQMLNLDKSLENSNNLTGKLFRSFGNISKSKSKDGFHIVTNNNNNLFSKFKTIHRKKNERVKLLPKVKDEDRKIEEGENAIKIIRNKSRSLINDKRSNIIIPIETSKEYNSIAPELNHSTKRPSSVIPLKIQKDETTLINKKKIIKQKDQQSTNTSEPSSITNQNKMISIKENQSSRASLHNIQTTTADIQSHRIEDTHNSINLKIPNKKQSTLQKKKQMTLKLINVQAKKTSLNNNCNIIKIITNKTVSAFNRSKKSSKTLKHFNGYNTKYIQSK